MKLTASAESEFQELALVCEGARTVGVMEWQSIDPAVSIIFPDWYRDLISRHALIGIPFGIKTKWNQTFDITLTEPEMVSGSLEEFCAGHYAFPPLIESEYFPIGFSEDGDIFVARRDLPTGVFQFQLEWDGDESFVAGVIDETKWNDISEFASELMPEGYSSSLTETNSESGPGE